MEKIEHILDEIEGKLELRNYLDSLMDKAKNRDSDVFVPELALGSSSAIGDSISVDINGSTVIIK